MCTANQCRSPMAEGLLRRRLVEARIDAEVCSAGLLEGGQPVSPAAVEAMSERGVDLTSRRTRQIDANALAGADLVVGMSLEHVREAVVLAPDVWPRAFRLKELVRRAAGVGGRGRGEPFDAWLARVAAGREVTDLLRPSPDDDVADPIGGPLEEFRRVADELDALLGHLVDLAWAPEVSGALRAAE